VKAEVGSKGLLKMVDEIRRHLLSCRHVGQLSGGNHLYAKKKFEIFGKRPETDLNLSEY
jgi:hypothetical protein